MSVHVSFCVYDQSKLVTELAIKRVGLAVNSDGYSEQLVICL